MADSSGSPGHSPFKVVGIIISVVSLLALISVLNNNGSQNRSQIRRSPHPQPQLQEDYSLDVDHQGQVEDQDKDKDHPYHDTLEVSFDLDNNPSVNPIISSAEKIWQETGHLRINQSHTETKDSSAGDNSAVKWIKLLQYFPPSFNCPYVLETLGDDPFGTWTCGLELLESKEECAFYSFGTSSDLDPAHPNFESELLDRTANCRVYIYDVKPVKVDPTYKNRVEFQTVPNTNSNQIKILSSLLKANGHGWADILKIDLGTGNHTQFILDQITEEYKEVLPFGQLQIRLPVPLHANQTFNEYVQWFQKLEEKGLRPFHAHVEQIKSDHDNMTSVEGLMFQYSFINIFGKHILLTGSV